METDLFPPISGNGRKTVRIGQNAGIIAKVFGSQLAEQGGAMAGNERSTMGDGSAACDHPEIRQTSTGDGLDIVQLVEDHHEAVYRYAYRLTFSIVDAEDLTQQTFLVAQQKLGQIREPEKVGRWLFAVLRSRFLKDCRKRVPAPVSSLEMDIEDLQDRSAGDDSHSGDFVDRELLDRALGELPEPFRLVLVMHYFEDCSYKEIARQLKMPIGTVMSRLARAKTQLRQRMARQKTPLR